MVGVPFYDVLCGFWARQGTGTASLEAKLFHHLKAMREEVIYKVFLDLQKAYCSLYREQFLDIIVGYGVGPRKERILGYYWDQLSMVGRLFCYYSTPFKGHLGVTHGDPLYPTIFNMLVDVVICHWVTLVAGEEVGLDGFRWVYNVWRCYF